MKNRWSTARVEAFSDGVFAIAITLLVLEIGVPESDFGDLWRGILDQWPSYLAFATSFLTIGAFWLLHHGIFRRLRFEDARVMRLNLLLLMAITFLPFPTKLMAQAITSADSERAAVVLYGVDLLVISGLFAALWEACVRGEGLLEPEVSAEDIAAYRALTAPSAGFYLAVIVLAIIAPVIAAFGFLVIAVLAILRARGDEPASIPESAPTRSAGG